MTVIVAALGWSWLGAEVDPLTGAVGGDPRDRGPSQSELAALEHALRLAQRWEDLVVSANVGHCASQANVQAVLAGRHAVLSVEAAGVRMRRAGLPATLASGHAAIRVARVSAATAAQRIRVLGAHPYRPRPRELAGPSGTALRRTLELTGALVE